MDDESTKEKPPEDSRDNLPADELEKIEFKKIFNRDNLNFPINI